MKKRLALAALTATVLVVACSPAQDRLWFGGTFDEARSVAAERDTLVMVEFVTDWCGWCRRMEQETFSDAEVRRSLRGMVALKLDAEREGRELALRYGVTSYPTVVFVDSQGNEVERILGYHPPRQFLELLQDIRLGDTFTACLARLEEDPADLDALERAVEGFLERSDPESAMARIEAYHATGEHHSHEACRRLMFAARGELLSRLYGRAAMLYQRGWDQPFEVPDTKGVAALRELVMGGVWELAPDAQAKGLRRARVRDAEAVLSILPPDHELPSETLFAAGRFAVRNGLYDRSAFYYRRWFDRVSDGADAGDLNAAAWDLYLADRDPDLALEMARAAFAGDPTPSVLDTLARLQYDRGQVDQAIELENRAAAEAQGAEAERYRLAAQRMADGDPLLDLPPFELYPGEPPGGADVELM